MTSDMIFESDKRQSISDADVAFFAKPIPDRINDKTGRVIKGRPAIQLTAGVKCAKDASHGRLLMSAKTGHLECGACGYQAAAPKD